MTAPTTLRRVRRRGIRRNFPERNSCARMRARAFQHLLPATCYPRPLRISSRRETKKPSVPGLSDDMSQTTRRAGPE